MSYRLNKTDGTLLVELADGQIDTSTTDITLVGRNYKGFGEFINENYIKMLENFSSTTAPSAPLLGQLWYDTSVERLKLYDGTTFRTAGSPIVSNEQPSMVAGDLWIDSEQNRLYFFDGSDLVLVGPQYSAAQGKTGLEPETVVDINNVSRTVSKMYIASVLVAVIANEEFRLGGDRKISGYPDDPTDTNIPPRQYFQPGFNIVSDDFRYRGVVDNALNLIDVNGTSYSPQDFVPVNIQTDAQGTIVDTAILGTVFVQNSSGISIGVGSTKYNTWSIGPGNTTTFTNNSINTDYNFRVKQGSSNISALYIDASEQSVGIFQDTPQANLDVTGTGRFTGDVTIEGDLTVTGDATYLNVSTLTVQDKNIEIGLLDDSTEGDDTQVDGSGIIVRSINGSKDLTWEQSTGSWTSNQDFDLDTNKSYRIDGTRVLSKDTLHSTVQTSSLTILGTLEFLNVDNLTIDDNIITTTGTGLSIVSADAITINDKRITGVATPTQATDAATKQYVDNENNTYPTYLTLDITGFTNPSVPGVNNGPVDNVKQVLDTIAPVTTANNGLITRILCIDYGAASVSGISVTVGTSGSEVLQKSYIAVDSNGTQNESVVQDIVAANDAAGSIALSPVRYFMTFVVSGGVWTQQGNTSTFTPTTP